MPTQSFPDNHEFNNPAPYLGHIVALIANPAINGVIIQVIQNKPEKKYVVIHNGNKATYYAMQLRISEEPCPSINTFPDQEVFDSLDSLRHQLWAVAREEHQRINAELAQYRKVSLTSSYKSRLNILQDQLNNATNEKIRWMKFAEINLAEIQANIITQVVVFEVMVVKGENVRI
ncbi:MAG: hypothetical protein IT392_01050 [Nitrospirae bacterium]|nr:hypothetical protein [Nitrospirota bacterium]